MRKNGENLREWCKKNNRPDILNRWSDLNESDPSEVAYGSDKKYKWRCEKGHNFEASPNKMTRRPPNKGCPYCANQKVLAGFNDLESNFPDIAKEWHPTKNGSMSPSQIAAKSNRTVWWFDNKGHEWQARPADRIKGKQCPYCMNRKLLRGFNDLATRYPELAAQWHLTKNGSIKPGDVIFGSNKIFWWTCGNGHDFKASLPSRVNAGTGCPICSNRVVLAGSNDLATLYPDIAEEWHPTKNGKIKPTDIVSGSRSKYWWLCPKGHEYQASPENRTKKNSKGTGCPICAGESQTSFPEQCIYYYFKQHFPKTKNRYVMENYELDIFVPELNTGIEYDGIFYHKDNRRTAELEKEKYYTAKNIDVLRVKEYKTSHANLSENIVWLDTRKNQFSEIKRALIRLSKKLNLGQIFDDINVKNDSPKIMENYYFNTKENSLVALYPDLLKEWDYNKNGNLNPEYLTAHSSKAVYWICELGHSYVTSIDARTRKDHPQGCPYCAGQKVLAGFNDLETKFPNIAAEWDSDKNEGLKPCDVMPHTRRKVYWLCRSGHSYSASISSRTNCNSGCPYCSGRKPIQGETDLQALFPDIAAQWHPTKNKELKPCVVPSKSHKKVWWLCPKGHDYFAPISNRTSNGNGCPYCSGRKVLASFNDLATRFPEVAKRWHPTKNNDKKPEETAPFSTKKAWWIDEYGKEYERRIDSEVRQYKSINEKAG